MKTSEGCLYTFNMLKMFCTYYIHVCYSMYNILYIYLYIISFIVDMIYH